MVEVEVSGLGRLTNTVVDWDVDLSGPASSCEVSANTLHVALAMPEDEAERAVRTESRDMIQIRRIDHVALRVADLDEATPAGHPVRPDRGASGSADHAYLRCGYEPYSLELIAPASPATTTPAGSFAAAARWSDAAAPPRPPRHRPRAPRRRPASAPTPTATGIELMPFRDEDDRRPPVAAAPSTLPGPAPRKLGHVNFLTADLAAPDRVLHRRAGHAKLRPTGWATRQPGSRQLRPPRDGARAARLRALPPHGVRHASTGECCGCVRPPRPARPLAGWGPVRHGVGQNICAYVRIPEEQLFVELYCDMEQLEPDHEPRDWPDDRHSSNTWGRCRPAPISASTSRRSATSARAWRCSARSSHPSRRSRS